MEVTEDVITDSMGLEMDGIKFYWERKLSNRAIDEFVESEHEKIRLMKIGNLTSTWPLFLDHGDFFFLL